MNMRLPARIVAAAALAASVSAVVSPVTFGCSPPFEPSINKLDPTDFVVVGYTGERVTGGRLFHVYRSYNAADLTTPFVIAFKEGEPSGDCSYRVATGQELIIALSPNPDGPPGASLATLQADPASEIGRRYLAEAQSRYGPGIVPNVVPNDAASPPPGSGDGSASRPDLGPLAIGLVGGIGLFGVVVLIARRQRSVGAPD